MLEAFKIVFADAPAFLVRVFVVASVLFIGWASLGTIFKELNRPIKKYDQPTFKPVYKQPIESNAIRRQYILFPHIRTTFGSRTLASGKSESRTEKKIGCDLLKDKCHGFDRNGYMFMDADLYKSKLTSDLGNAFYIKTNTPKRYALATEMCKNLGSTISAKQSKCMYPSNTIVGDRLNTTFEKNVRNLDFSKLIDEHLKVVE